MQSTPFRLVFKAGKSRNKVAAGVEWEEIQGKLEGSHLDDGSNSGKEKKEHWENILDLEHLENICSLVFCDSLASEE